MVMDRRRNNWIRHGMVPQSNMVLGLDLASQLGPLCVEFAGTENTCMGLQYCMHMSFLPLSKDMLGWMNSWSVLNR